MHTKIGVYLRMAGTPLGANAPKDVRRSICRSCLSSAAPNLWPPRLHPCSMPLVAVAGWWALRAQRCTPRASPVPWRIFNTAFNPLMFALPLTSKGRSALRIFVLASQHLRMRVQVSIVGTGTRSCPAVAGRLTSFVRLGGLQSF